MIDRLTITRQQYDEYDLKAALLGHTYDWRIHTFYIPNTSSRNGLPDLDPDTIEPLTFDQARSRKLGPNALYYGNGWSALAQYRRDREAGVMWVNPEPGHPGGKNDTS